ncbi:MULTISPECIES: ParA family protein [Exiguobacterium]|uniref:ParA family protein n=1 Tax=Exiguobacterium TaxID=33986 RepID=UPI000552ED9F|nr:MULTISPECIES: AAA family ATPase [Exiguobacterium]
MNRDGKVISFINMKGGVGKTTLCIELADQISNRQKSDGSNYKILLIDIDPQANLTQAINEHFYPADEDIPTKSIELLFNKKPMGFKPEDIIVSLPNENLDLIPGELETVFLERASGNSTSQKLMDFILDYKIKESYDLIIVDCPPTYSIYTEMAFFVSDYYFIPVIPDKYSLLGVDLLERVVSDIILNNKNSIFKEKVPQNIGVIFTRVNVKEKPKQENYMNALKSSPLAKAKNLYIFPEHFKESNKLSTFELGKLVSDTEDQRLQKMMDNICDDFLARIDSFNNPTLEGDD